MTRVKICGLTSIKDAKRAEQLGADAVGFVFAQGPRQVDPVLARNICLRIGPFTAKVGVFVNETMEEILRVKEFCGLTIVQLHGDEPDQMIHELAPGVIKAIKVKPNVKPELNENFSGTILLDTYCQDVIGGSGKVFDWELAKDYSKGSKIILAGGLTPDNVKEAIEKVRPYAVDVSSGVEIEPGRKDYAKLERFIRRAKGL